MGRAYQDSGGTWGKNGRQDERAKMNAAALKAYTQAIALDSNNAEAYFLRGKLYTELGTHEAAVSDFSRVIELNPKGPEAWYRADVELLRQEAQQKLGLPAKKN
jgi:tetratricopeptide (TPR) repeat protein